MRITTLLLLVSALVLAGCSSSRSAYSGWSTAACSPRDGTVVRVSQTYSDATPQGTIVRESAVYAEPTVAAFTPPPAPALPAVEPKFPAGTPVVRAGRPGCRPVFCPPACPPVDPCVGGNCGVPSLDDSCPGGNCGVPSLDACNQPCLPPVKFDPCVR